MTEIKTGRPSMYKEKYCQEMEEFFDRDYTIINKEGKEVANQLPTFEKYATSINVSRETLREWKKNHPMFSCTYEKCKNLQKDMLIHLGMIGLYKEGFTKFVAINITDMKDKVEQHNTGEPLTAINIRGLK